MLYIFIVFLSIPSYFHCIFHVSFRYLSLNILPVIRQLFGLIKCIAIHVILLYQVSTFVIAGYCRKKFIIYKFFRVVALLTAIDSIVSIKAIHSFDKNWSILIRHLKE